MSVLGYLFFLIAGLGFGFAAPGLSKLLPLLFPIALWLGAVAREGVDGTALLRLLLALVVTAIGIVIGAVLDRRGSQGRQAGYA
jgi:hypothetical protein